MSVNKVQLLGRVGNDITLTQFENGGCIANISLATDESYKDKDGNKVEKTEWHKVVARNKTAEILSQYLKKGNEVFISGKLATRKWTDTEGKDNWVTEVIVETFSFIGGQNNG